ncbi:Monocarboxylate transporter 10 [Halotydeus destructor]|nr:Monocarboxylate transporter 10 [Halotydeus destructor]
MDNKGLERSSLTTGTCPPDIIPSKKQHGHQSASLTTTEDTSRSASPVSLSDGEDGGFWAWIVVLGAFLANGIIFGVINCFGVLFESIQNQFVPDETDAKFLTSCVGSTTVGMTFCFSFIASIMTDRFGVRSTAVLGSILAIIGMFASSYATTIVHLYLTYGIILGLGCSLAYTPSLVILGHYFTRRLGIVNGVVTAGSSLFTMTMAIALKGILKDYGLQCTLRILTGLMVVLFLASLTFIDRKPKKDQQSVIPRQSSVFNRDIWTNRLYIIWVIAIPVALFGYFVPYVHLVGHVKDILPEANGELLVTTLGASSGLGRIIFGPISDSPKINRIIMQQMAFVTIGSLTLMLIFARQFNYLVAICVGLGLADGCFISLLGPIAFDLVGQTGASQAIGFLLAFCSVPLTLGPPIAGYLYDLTKNYNMAFLCAGIPPFLGALFMTPILRSPSPKSLPLTPTTVVVSSSTSSEARTSSTTYSSNSKNPCEDGLSVFDDFTDTQFTNCKSING